MAVFGVLTCQILELEFAQRIFGMADYERSLLIPTAALSLKQMRKNIEEFNQLLGLRTDLLQGTIAILAETWAAAKQHLKRQTEAK
jgi:hypothetical protein